MVLIDRLPIVIAGSEIQGYAHSRMIFELKRNGHLACDENQEKKRKKKNFLFKTKKGNKNPIYKKKWLMNSTPRNLLAYV